MKIPKIIHYCWFGPKPIPELELKCMQSWKKFLPDYKLMFWNEKTFDIYVIIPSEEGSDLTYTNISLNLCENEKKIAYTIMMIK